MPQCGEKVKITIWNSLNITLNPELKEELFQGRIYIFHCQKCKFVVQFPNTFIYHDMKRKFCVMYFPVLIFGNEDMLNKTFTEDGDVIPISNDMPDYMKKMHIVFDMDELVRYIQFRERLLNCSSEKG